ncbi:MAG: hypothetical protein A2046_03310 [Bacteroidetes bacterium GWA2_30_7]|nr:MAG: hypothetical protein A2046_03310 [Bacteroidetes bacterium GWA2_30_7]
MSKVILIADDERSNLQVIVKYINESTEKYEVMCAPNGKVACEIATASLPDLILMDWEMPEMNGIEAIKWLKNEPSTKDIPVLMVSALSSSEDIEMALDTGAIDYIRKPINKTELLARVKSALRIAQQFKNYADRIKSLEAQLK